MRITTSLSAGLTALALILTGCSSSGGSDAGGNNPGGSNAPGDSVAGTSTTTPALAAAQATIQAALKPPNTLPITGALKSKPETGKTIIYIQCEVAQCALEGKGLQSAAQALGWTYKNMSFQAANPATLVTALKDALRFKPLAVYFSGVPYDVWKSVIPDYKSAGSYIVPSAVPNVPLDGTVIASLGADALYVKAGKLLADTVAVDSNGSGKILFTTVPAYTIFKPLQDGYDAELKAVCPGCKSTTFGATIPQVTGNQMVPGIVSALKRDPDIKYVASANGDFLQTLPGALQSAGMAGKVKIFTFSGGTSIQQLVQQGQIQTTTAFGYNYEGWLGVDAALRASQGMPVSDEHSLLPLPLLTKDTITTPKDSIDLPADYQAQFKKLWLVG